MNRIIRFVVALIAGGLSGCLIYMASYILFIGDDIAPNWFVPVILLGSWAISTYFLLHGARTISNVIARSFLLGAAEWLAMIPIGLIMGGMTVAEVTDEVSTDAEMAGAAFGGGIIAFVTGGVSIAMIFFCLLGYLITFLTTREMKQDSKSEAQNSS